jgi:UDP-2,3-diacylglucosamine pyrophosphatase LpxH
MESDAMSEECPERRFRTLFISDVHLGARGSQAERLLDFLRSHDADTIYLVGDIVDGWALRSNWYWPQSHNDFVQKMLRKARKGAKVIYVPGNHDEFLRNYYGTHFGTATSSISWCRTRAGSPISATRPMISRSR